MTRYYYITPEDYEIAEKNGINKGALEWRVKRQGWSVDKAIKTPLRKQKGIDPKWRAIAEENGISYIVFWHRIRRSGWDPEKAATTPLQDKELNLKHVKPHTVIPKSIHRLAEKNGIKYSTLYSRIRR